MRVSRTTGLALVALMALTALTALTAACGSGAESASDQPEDLFDADRWCAELTDAIGDVEESFQADDLAELSVDFYRTSAGDLRRLVDGLPGDEPSGVGDVLDVAAGWQELFAVAVDADDQRATVRNGLDPLLTQWEAIDDVESAEAWVEQTCDIEVLAIQLRLRDDDRTAVAEG